MSPIQQMLLGVGAVATKTYVDDVFSTFLYEGNGSSQSINNGINLSGEGGMVWVKDRDSQTYDEHALTDTLRGIGKELQSNSNIAETTQTTNRVTAFNSNGFTVGEGHRYNKDDDDYASWTFRKAKGFFDVVKYTAGNGTTQSIAHNLGCVPGCIMVKRLTGGSESWAVYHKNMSDGTTAAPGEKACELDTNSARKSSTSYFTATLPTATHFYVGSNNGTGASGEDYVAYIFAGGEQKGNASTKFGGSDDDYSKVSISTSDLDWSASDDLTIEAWVRVPDVSAIGSNGARVFTRWSSNNYSFLLSVRNDGSITFGHGNGGGSVGGAPDSTTGHITDNTWHHIAVTRDGSSNTGTFWIDGTSRGTISGWSNASTNSSEPLYIGDGEVSSSSGYFFDGYISNARITIGQKLYTSNFTPSTAPLTTTSQGATASNVKFLGCNDPDQRSSTKTPGAISISGDVEGSNLSPFSSSTGSDYILGDSGDQNVIKCGSYIGNGSATAPPEMNLAWEPQWVLIKRVDANENWFLWDSMRGIVTGGNDARLIVNSSGAENDTTDRVDLTPTGFKAKTSSGEVNANGGTYIYICIRRPDGYVGKPVELGTDVFNIVNQATDGVSPFFRNIGFPVDFAIFKKVNDSSHNWGASPRLTQGYYLSTNQTRAENANNHQQFGYMDAWNSGTETSGDYMSWAWKRHAGFDVVTYEGNGTAGLQVSHNLNGVPEMIWTKCRGLGNSYANWGVGHKDLDGGNAPWTHYLVLDENGAEADWDGMFNDTAPTATHFTVGEGSTMSNASGEDMVAFLFRSIDGVSKVGSYTGNGSSTGPVISLGFTPRFILFKNASSGGNGWAVLDTLRGRGTSSQKRIWLEGNWAQDSGNNYVTTTSTSFQPVMNNTEFNENNSTIIYYAHA